jgi:hypothetical protein
MVSHQTNIPGHYLPAPAQIHPHLPAQVLAPEPPSQPEMPQHVQRMEATVSHTQNASISADQITVKLLRRTNVPYLGVPFEVSLQEFLDKIDASSQYGGLHNRFTVCMYVDTCVGVCRRVCEYLLIRLYMHTHIHTKGPVYAGCSHASMEYTAHMWACVHTNHLSSVCESFHV